LRAVLIWLYCVGVRLRVLAFVLALIGAFYLLWSWAVAAGHDIPAIVAGVALVPLFIVLLALTVRQIAVTLGWVARRPRRRPPARGAGISPSATTMMAGEPAEPTPTGVSSASSPAKFAA
jgi:hypothetical protein